MFYKNICSSCHARYILLNKYIIRVVILNVYNIKTIPLRVFAQNRKDYITLFSRAPQEVFFCLPYLALKITSSLKNSDYWCVWYFSRPLPYSLKKQCNFGHLGSKPWTSYCSPPTPSLKNIFRPKFFFFFLRAGIQTQKMCLMCCIFS